MFHFIKVVVVDTNNANQVPEVQVVSPHLSTKQHGGNICDIYAEKAWFAENLAVLSFG